MPCAPRAGEGLTLASRGFIHPSPLPGSSMKVLTNQQIQEKRALAQSIDVSLQVGKNGITESTVAELKAQLHKRKLVKVRLLKSATEGGAEDDAQAQALATAADAILIERRGHTAVYFRG